MHKTIAFLLVLLPLVGCSAPKSHVYGKILYKGKPLAGGTIVLVCPDNSTAQSRIGVDGSYEIPAVSRGHVLVAIQADRPRPKPRGRPNPKAVAVKDRNEFAKDMAKGDDQRRMAQAGPANDAQSEVVDFPKTYGDPNQSQLSFDLIDPDYDYSVDLAGQ